MSEFPNKVTVLLEPTAACNLRCKHCYHAKTNYDKTIMELATLDKFLSISAPFYNGIKIIWHGGEPLLAGHEFYKKAFEYFSSYSQKYNVSFSFGVQTNATLLDEEYLNLFTRNQAHVSVSYDGRFNDILRQKTNIVEDKIDILKAKKMHFSCIATITKQSINKIVELYEEFKRKEISFKFNPIIPDGAAENSIYLMTKEEWTNGFIKLFKYWFYDKECNINVSNCREVLENYLGMVRSGCINGNCMFRFLAVDAYGNIYPCGRLIEKSNILANVFQIEDIREAFLSSRYKYILEGNLERISNCKKCKWFSKCHAGCNASSYIEKDFNSKNDFNCYFVNNVYYEIEKMIDNYDDKKVNNYVKEIMIKYNNRVYD